MKLSCFCYIHHIEGAPSCGAPPFCSTLITLNFLATCHVDVGHPITAGAV